MYRVNPLIENMQTTAYTTPVENPPDEYKASCLVSECPYGTSPAALRVIRRIDREELSGYPHKKEEVISAIAYFWQNVADITEKNVIPGEGSADIMFKINRLFLTNPDVKALLGIEPQFLAYHNDLMTYPVRYDTYNLTEKNNYKIDIDEMIEMIQPDHALIYINNPNNPTGQIIPLEEVERIVKAAQKNGSVIIIDEAYGDYMDKENSACRLVSQYDNLIVMRSFSKGFGLAGVRAAYLLVPEWLVPIYNKTSTPYCMNALAQEIVLAVLKDRKWLPTIRQWVREDKARILEALPEQIHVAYTSNDVPIILAYVDDPEVNLHHLFAKYAIEVVSGTSYIGLGQESVRICLTDNIDDLLDALKVMREGIAKDGLK